MLARGYDGAELFFLDTPLHLAAEGAHADAARLMVEYWPDGKRAINKIGQIPLAAFLKWADRQLLASRMEEFSTMLLLGF
jgi:hypothetical protein